MPMEPPTYCNDCDASGRRIADLTAALRDVRAAIQHAFRTTTFAGPPSKTRVCMTARQFERLNDALVAPFALAATEWMG